MSGLRPIPSVASGGPVTGGESDRWPAAHLVGVTPSGSIIEVAVDRFDRPILLAFLATRCDGCAEFWQGFTRGAPTGPPASVAPVVVTRGPDSVAPSEVARLAAGLEGVPVIMSDSVWTEYRVLGYPFFVLVDPRSRTVIGETVGFGWSDVVAMVESSHRSG
ncbi:MAG: hypothetical protein ACLQPH_20515 [Acidimicrobiales bacterium]